MLLLAGTLAIAGVTTIAAVHDVHTPDPAQLRSILNGGLAMLGGVLYLAIPGATFVLVRANEHGVEWVLLAMLAPGGSRDAAAQPVGPWSPTQLAPSDAGTQGARLVALSSDGAVAVSYVT